MQIIKWKEENFLENEVKVNVLSQNSNAKEIQILLAKDAIMKEHKAPFDISVQVLSGKISFGVLDKEFILNELDMISLKANEIHSLKALENSIVRLSLAQSDTIARVKDVLKK